MQSFQSKETKSDERPLRLLFLLSRFLDGGIDTVLLEYVNHLADHLHYDVTLGIAICYGDLEVYRPKLACQGGLLQSESLSHATFTPTH